MAKMFSKKKEHGAGIIMVGLSVLADHYREQGHSYNDSLTMAADMVAKNIHEFAKILQKDE